MIPMLLVLLPMLAAAAVYPLDRRDARGVNVLLLASAALELLLALSLLLVPAVADAPGVCGTGLRFTSARPSSGS